MAKAQVASPSTLVKGSNLGPARDLPDLSSSFLEFDVKFSTPKALALSALGTPTWGFLLFLFPVGGH